MKTERTPLLGLPPGGRASGSGIGRLAQPLRWSVKFHGLAGTGVNALAGGLRCLRAGRALQRWCREYKDRCFDARFGVETTEKVPVDHLDMREDRKPLAVEYAPTSPVRFCRVIARLGIDYRDYAFIDLG